MKNNVVAVIAAGGRGVRMGAGIPKQYIKIGGKPVVIHTLLKFLPLGFDSILLLVPNESVPFAKRMLREYSISGVDVIAGGKTRNDTILNAVSFLRQRDELDESTILVTHDSVRPFVSEKTILDSVKTCREKGICTAAIKATDTIIRGNARVTEHFDRSEMLQVQTPQTFNAMRFESLYTSLDESRKLLATDCTRLFSLAGDNVYIIEGDKENIKLTYESDLAFAEGYLMYLNGSHKHTN